MKNIMPPWKLTIFEGLKTYNEQWKQYIQHKINISDDRLVILLTLSEETRQCLEGITFVSAKWVSHELSTGNKNALVDVLVKGKEYTLYVKYRLQPKEQELDFEFFLPIHQEEEQLISDIFLEFGIIEMIEEVDKLRN